MNLTKFSKSSALLSLCLGMSLSIPSAQSAFKLKASAVTPVVSSDVIDQAIAAVASSEMPDFANTCTLEVATQIVATNFGSFAVCIEDFQATLIYVSATGTVTPLAAFQDGEADPFETRVIYTGNICAEVTGPVGRQCFANSAGILANAFLPKWKSRLALTETIVANQILTTFSPQTINLDGTVGRCFYNTGDFTVTGLSGQNAQLALSQRQAAYAACENSQGDSRLWTMASWALPFGCGAAVIGAGVSIAAMFPCLTCCVR